MMKNSYVKMGIRLCISVLITFVGYTIVLMDTYHLSLVDVLDKLVNTTIYVIMYLILLSLFLYTLFELFDFIKINAKQFDNKIIVFNFDLNILTKLLLPILILLFVCIVQLDCLVKIALGFLCFGFIVYQSGWMIYDFLLKIKS